MIRLLETGTLSSTPPSKCFAFITDKKEPRKGCGTLSTVIVPHIQVTLVTYQGSAQKNLPFTKWSLLELNIYH